MLCHLAIAITTSQRPFGLQSAHLLLQVLDVCGLALQLLAGLLQQLLVGGLLRVQLVF